MNYRAFAVLTSLTFVIVTGLCRTIPADEPNSDAFSIRDIDDKRVGVFEGYTPVFTYVHGPVTHEACKDHRKTRACYIHPVYGMQGEELTDDFPRDHFHHHGVFWSWPYVSVGDKTYDNWEYRNITERFVRWVKKEAGEDGALLSVENGWFIEEDGKEKKIMTVQVDMRANPADATSRTIDLDLYLTPTDQPVALQGRGGKSYGGLTMRFAGIPERDTIVRHGGGEKPFVESDTPARKDLVNTRLGWADFSRQYPDLENRSGAAVFIAPDHPDYPPTWLTRHYGPQCVGWPGVKKQELKPGETTKLSYRIYVHKDEMKAPELQAVYEKYLEGQKAE